MGGLSLAARELGMRIVAGLDVNAQAARTFSKNFPEAEFIQSSVRSAKALQRCGELLRNAAGTTARSIVLSGPPCQGFSVAGSRDPADPRNQILAAVARAITELNPHCALVENVAAVLTERHISKLLKFKDTLGAAGYVVHRVLLDAAQFGVAQKRKRAFFLIARKQLDEEQIQHRFELMRQTELSVEVVLNGLPVPPVRPEEYDDEEDYGGVHNHFTMRHSQRVMDKIAALKPGTGPMSYRKLHPSRPAKTLFSGHRAPPAHFLEPRSITVREAARLQGFPDWFRIFGSFGNQMQQVTNAVPPPLAKTVLRVLAEFTDLPLPVYA
jgi:DNA (cytosine-5)-methyltransferase 1